MIDVWMLFTMICPFFEILMLWLKDQIKRDIGSTQGKHVQKEKKFHHVEMQRLINCGIGLPHNFCHFLLLTAQKGYFCDKMLFLVKKQKYRFQPAMNVI